MATAAATATGVMTAATAHCIPPGRAPDSGNRQGSATNNRYGTETASTRGTEVGPSFDHSSISSTTMNAAHGSSDRAKVLARARGDAMSTPSTTNGPGSLGA